MTGISSVLVWFVITFGTLLMLAAFTSAIKDTGAEASSLLAATRRYSGTRVDTKGEILKDVEGKILVSDTSDILDGFETSLVAEKMTKLSMMTLDERQAHFRFTQFLLHSPLGSEVFGIFISKSFVYESFAKVAVLVPSVVSILQILRADADSDAA